MEILYLLIPLSLAIVFVIGAIFWCAVQSGQFDDLEGPAHRILMDEEPRRRRTQDGEPTVLAKMPDAQSLISRPLSQREKRELEA
jgi:cbb3-type cytochrome oxidase maturation protein